MDEKGSRRVEADGNVIPGWSWWALASCTQFVWGMSSYRKGYAGDSRLMPFKAFAVASLFVGSAASASFAALQASGIHKVSPLPLIVCLLSGVYKRSNISNLITSSV